jgi:hypothetical protein
MALNSYLPEEKTMKKIAFSIALSMIFLSIIACSVGSTATPTSVVTHKLQVINDSSFTVCYVYISLNTSEEWGNDWLESNTIDPGEDYIFEVEPGVYDLRADDCDNATLATEQGVDLTTEDKSWTLSDLNTQG